MEHGTEYRLSLHPDRVAAVLAGVSLLLIGLHVLLGSLSWFVLGQSELYGFVPMMKLTAEQNIPTFFSTFLLLSRSPPRGRYLHGK